jgi:hypothetical protein
MSEIDDSLLLRSNNASGYRYVNKTAQGYRGQLNPINHHVGTFPDAITCARAVYRAMLEYKLLKPSQLPRYRGCTWTAGHWNAYAPDTETKKTKTLGSYETSYAAHRAVCSYTGKVVQRCNTDHDHQFHAKGRIERWLRRKELSGWHDRKILHDEFVKQDAVASDGSELPEKRMKVSSHVFFVALDEILNIPERKKVKVNNLHRMLLYIPAVGESAPAV